MVRLFYFLFVFEKNGTAKDIKKERDRISREERERKRKQRDEERRDREKMKRTERREKRERGYHKRGVRENSEKEREREREREEKSMYLLGQVENRCKVKLRGRCKSDFTFYANFDVSQHPPRTLLIPKQESCANVINLLIGSISHI